MSRTIDMGCKPCCNRCCYDGSSLNLNISTLAFGDCVTNSQNITLTKVDGQCAWEGVGATPCSGVGTVLWRFELSGSDPDCVGVLSLYCDGDSSGVPDLSWSGGWRPGIFYPPTQWIQLLDGSSAPCYDFESAGSVTLRIT